MNGSARTLRKGQLEEQITAQRMVLNAQKLVEPAVKSAGYLALNNIVRARLADKLCWKKY